MKRFSKLFLVFIFFLMMLFPCFSALLPDLPISGVFKESTPPVLSARTLIDGTCQTDAENYFNEHLPGREYLIKTKNQLVFNFFNKSPVPEVLIGKNKQMLGASFVYYWYQLTGPTTDEYIEHLTQTIDRFQALMDAQGIHTFLYVTPSKVRFYQEDVPQIYRFAAPENPEPNAYDKLMKALEPLQIPCFDSIAYLQEVSDGKSLDGYPLFNKTGTHWTQTTGARVAAALGDSIEHAFGYDLAEMSIEPAPAAEPVFPDADIFDILNMYTGAYDTYTEPVITITEEGRDHPGMLCRGGSFMGQSLAHLVRQGYFSKDICMENTQFFRERFTNVQQFTDYDSVDIKEAFENIELVILEVNESSVDVMSFGFMDYVLEHQNEIFP